MRSGESTVLGVSVRSGDDSIPFLSSATILLPGKDLEGDEEGELVKALIKEPPDCPLRVPVLLLVAVAGATSEAETECEDTREGDEDEACTPAAFVSVAPVELSFEFDLVT